MDSVIDVTHNVPVPFADSMGGGWGILNQSDYQRRGVGRRGHRHVEPG